MPFTTLQDRALTIPRQPMPGSQFQKVKFQLGEMHTILPPVGTEIINCQGVDIGPEGKRLQITKELISLIQAGFVRIAHDITNPDADKHGAKQSDSPSPVSSGGEGEGGTAASHVEVGVSSQIMTTEGDAKTPSVSFSSVEEIRACRDRERVRLYIKGITGWENEKAHIEGLRDMAEKYFLEAQGKA